QSRCRSLPAGDCVGMHAAQKESPARPAPTVPKPRSTTKQSRCRSLPAGDCVGTHAVQKNRRQGQLLQCQNPAPRQTEAAVGACPQAIGSACMPPESITGKACPYSPETPPHGKPKPPTEGPRHGRAFADNPRPA